VPIRCDRTRIIAPKTSRILKDVLSKCYGGDSSRSASLLEKAEGRKAMKMVVPRGCRRRRFIAALQPPRRAKGPVVALGAPRRASRRRASVRFRLSALAASVPGRSGLHSLSVPRGALRFLTRDFNTPASARVGSGETRELQRRRSGGDRCPAVLGLNPPLDTSVFGGGTRRSCASCSPHWWRRSERIRAAGLGGVTTEANPETRPPEGLAQLAAARHQPQRVRPADAVPHLLA